MCLHFSCLRKTRAALQDFCSRRGVAYSYICTIWLDRSMRPGLLSQRRALRRLAEVESLRVFECSLRDQASGQCGLSCILVWEKRRVAFCSFFQLFLFLTVWRKLSSPGIPSVVMVAAHQAGERPRKSAKPSVARSRME